MRTKFFSDINNIFLLLSITSISTWLLFQSLSEVSLLLIDTIINFSIIFFIYLLAHTLRLFRIYLFLLEKKEKIKDFQLIHIHSAFFSSLLPYKLGELIRLSGFLATSQSKNNSFTLWLNERFFDVVSIVISIILIFLLNIEISSYLKNLFILFTLVVFLGLFLIIAVTNFITFLNRHLIINSISKRSLSVLRFGNFIENLKEIVVSMSEKRLLILISLSLFIWFVEIASILTYIRLFSANINVSDAFAAILLGNIDSIKHFEILPFVFCRTLALALMTILFYLLCTLKNTFWERRQ